MNERRIRRKPGENRTRLLEAGLTEFGLFGYHGASTLQIARRAGVPQPHVYANFGSKLELFVACVRTVADGTASGGAIKGSPQTQMLLFQAIAAAQDPELREQLLPVLTDVRELIGADAFLRLITDGADALLGLRHSGDSSAN